MGLFRTLGRGVAWLSLGAAAGAVVVTARHLLETPQPLESAFPDEGHIDRNHGGDIYYNLSGPDDAQPLVLLHDFYPGASNFEFREIFPRLAQRYRVYAPDWLGFGMSEHPAIAYTGEFYAGVLSGFLRDIVSRPAVVLAHGRAANITVRAASDNPALFERIILVAPDVFAGVMDEPTLAQTLVRATRRVSLGLVPYAMLSTRPALRWLTTVRSLRASEGVPADETVDHLYASAHQTGGQYALLAALTGDLDLAMPNAFALLEPPVLIVSGERDRRHPRVDMEDIAILNPHADLDVIPNAGDIVFEDQPDAFLEAVTHWLDIPASRHAIDESDLLSPVEEEDELPGTPDSVVPGVSDSGQEGPATVDVLGVSTLEEPTVTLGPQPTEAAAQEMEASTGSANLDELPPEAPNIADAGPTASQTTESGVATPADVTAINDVEVSGASEPVRAEGESHSPASEESASRPPSGQRSAAHQSLNRTRHEPAPKTQPQSGTRPSSPRSSRGQSAHAERSQLDTGRKRSKGKSEK